MIQEDAENLATQLHDLFRLYEVDVAVGVKKRGKGGREDDFATTIRSQTKEVDARNLAKVKAQ